MSNYWKNNEGVHYTGPSGEFTLCGDACDGLFETDVCAGERSYSEGDFEEMVTLSVSSKNRVTCPRCIVMIEHCRSKDIKY